MSTSQTIFCDRCGAANRSTAAYCRNCGNTTQSLTSTQQLPPATQTLAGLGSTLQGRYFIMKRLGRGGMGAVFRASDLRLRRNIALKELLLEDKQSVEDFEREALMLASLKHPNLPQIYDHFEENGRWYLVMEYIEGQTLEDYVKNSPIGCLQLEEVLGIGVELCNVLNYLHTRQPQIIFRDLKPANIMLASSGQIYLIDFGIARQFKLGQAKDTTAIGSPGYAAPEQYGRAQTTPQADIYSLGATLHQLLTGNEPTSFIFDLSEIRNTFMRSLLASTVALDVNQRPASVQDVACELVRIQQLSTPLIEVALAVPPASEIELGENQISQAPKRKPGVLFLFDEADRKYVKLLEPQIAIYKRFYPIDLFHNNEEMVPGTTKRRHYEKVFSQLVMVFVFCSIEFFVNEDMYTYLHEWILPRRKEIAVVPVLAKPHPAITSDDELLLALQVFPRNKIPLSQWKNPSDGIESIIEDLTPTIKKLLDDRK